MTINSIVKHKRGTTTQWDNATYILKDGEIGINTTLNKIKIGNGSSVWSNPDASSRRKALNALIFLAFCIPRKC